MSEIIQLKDIIHVAGFFITVAAFVFAGCGLALVGLLILDLFHK